MIRIADIASGMHPPIARNVRPITESGIPRVYPIIDIIQNVRKDVNPMKMMHMMNVSGYQRRI